jgi:hypothetical protein
MPPFLPRLTFLAAPAFARIGGALLVLALAWLLVFWALT